MTAVNTTHEVVVVGSITADASTVSDALPRPGETILGRAFLLALGGKGANQAVAAARAGAVAHMVGCIGDDMFAPFVRDQLDAAGVRTEGVITRSGPTGIAHIRIDGHGQNDIVMVPLANAKLTVDDVRREVLRAGESASVLLTQLEIAPEVAEAAVVAARDAGMLTLLDPAPAVPVPDGMWRFVDIVTPNETEAARYTGIDIDGDPDSVTRAGRWFTDHGVGAALITLGARGAALVTADAVEFFSGIAVDVVDTTAAGDTFAGYLGASLAGGADIVEAIRRAMAAGALSVTVVGASPSIPHAAAVDSIMTGRTA